MHTCWRFDQLLNSYQDLSRRLVSQTLVDITPMNCDLAALHFRGCGCVDDVIMRTAMSMSILWGR